MTRKGISINRLMVDMPLLGNSLNRGWEACKLFEKRTPTNKGELGSILSPVGSVAMFEDNGPYEEAECFSIFSLCFMPEKRKKR